MARVELDVVQLVLWTADLARCDDRDFTVLTVRPREARRLAAKLVDLADAADRENGT